MSGDFLEKYKPEIDLAQTFSFDVELPDNELTFDLNRKLVMARKLQDAAFIAIGKMLKTFRDRKLYTFLDYENFSQYLASEELSFSREKAYLYIRIYEVFVEKLKLDPNKISEMGVVRLQLLAPVVRDMEWEAAIKKIDEVSLLRYNDFVKDVKGTINKEGKPAVFFSEETGKWIVNFFSDKTQLVDMGLFSDSNS